MADMNKGYTTKSGLVVTPKGRMLYPGLFYPSVPKGETDQTKASYQLTLLFPKAADGALLVAAVDAAIVAKWGVGPHKFKIKKPFLKTEEQPRFADVAGDYPVMIRAGNKERPATVFGNMKPCTTEEEVYGGRWATMSLNAFAWDHPTGGKGVSFGLNHVMLLEHDEPMGGGRVRVEDAFEPVDVAGGSPDAKPESAESLFG